jgi:endo-1,4-beta-xylanase A
MKITKPISKTISILLLVCLIATSGGEYTFAKAKKAPKLSASKTVKLKAGASKKISVKKNGVKKLVKVTWKSSKKSCVAINKTKGTSVKIKGKSSGKATVTATVKYKSDKSSKTSSKKLKCKVTVSNDSEEQTPTPAPTANAPTDEPNETQSPGRTPGPTNLLSALSCFVENVGTCISYGGGWGGWGGSSAVADSATTAYIKENFNSLTAENEMKPCNVLGYQPTILTIEEAKNQGYIIPDSYTEAYVPQINYSNIDKLLKYAYDNGIRVRYHGLLWHEQSSNWFFRKNFDSSASYVTPEIMDARNEFFITNVMSHVYSGQYKDVVYCWDVINEYFHMTECISRIRTEANPDGDKNEDVKCYYEVYGDKIFEDASDPINSPVKSNPEYIKKAFKTAHDILKSYGLENKVELVYNDYDTNMNDVRRFTIEVANYINSKDELNPDGEKLLTTIGMQAHDKLGKHSISGHVSTIDAIKQAGYNIQFTEFDLALNGRSEAEQLQYLEDLITVIALESQDGAHFTCFSWWGMTDSSSWLGANESPLLCGTSVNDKKPAYYTVINTAYRF